MDIILTIIAVIVIFSLLVLIHESGHFLAARRAGIKVLEFGIGFPPRIFKKKVGDTIYSVNAIPFGGFVKLHGEDAASAEIIKDRTSYAHQTPWVRTKVVVAGVMMNFLLAIFLLTIGFTFGIDPLLVNQDDLYASLATGNVVTAPGVYVKSVDSGAAPAGIAAGDQIVAIDDKSITDTSQLAVFEKGGAQKDLDITISPKASVKAGAVQGLTKKIHIPLGKKNTLGIQLSPYTYFSRSTVFEVKPGSPPQQAGLRAGDVVLQVNGHDIYDGATFESALQSSPDYQLTVLRDGKELPIRFSLPDQKRVLITDVFPDSAAAKAGIAPQDLIISIDGKSVGSPEQVQELLKEHPGKEMSYRLNHNGVEREVQAKTDAKNILGVGLSLVNSYRNSQISFYQQALLTSITQIKPVRYAPWNAFKQAISETVRLTGLTIAAFGRTLQSLISKFAVPSDVGGPVQIAYYTHSFVQEGFFALLRFTALLSLSLAVINILPIPALDGGRFLFIVIEVILRKRVNARFEAAVHAIGFILLMLLILLVTYSDVTKLF